MALTNRQRGDYFERQVKATLEFHGWLVVRSAGSKGPFDLVAIRHGKTPMLVQCKLSGRIDPHERAATLESAHGAGARAVVAFRPRGGRVTLAAIVPGTSRIVPIDTLHVPAKPRAEEEATP
jgi:Holliday junction resolvase